jgi:hypothetical protein
MQTGLALEHERVEYLVNLFHKLADLAGESESLWIKDVKVLHLANDQVERIELRRFNGELIRNLRGLLDDIATETGGRLNRLRQPAGSEEPTPNLDDYSLEALSPAERDEFFRLQDLILSSSQKQKSLA